VFAAVLAQLLTMSVGFIVRRRLRGRRFRQGRWAWALTLVLWAGLATTLLWPRDEYGFVAVPSGTHASVHLSLSDLRHAVADTGKLPLVAKAFLERTGEGPK